MLNYIIHHNSSPNCTISGGHFLEEHSRYSIAYTNIALTLIGIVLISVGAPLNVVTLVTLIFLGDTHYNEILQT